MCLEPALALIAGLALLGQVPRAWSLAGIALVVAAGIGAVRTGGARQQAWRLNGSPRRGFPAGTTVRT